MRRLKLYATLFALWQSVAIMLGVWWGSLLLKQANQILVLERQTGVAEVVLQSHHASIRRMIFAESLVFFILLFGSAGMLGFLYLRDFKRSRSTEAFFASFTHELKTPLTSMRLQAEAISDNALNAVKNSQKNINRLLEDTLRLESQVEKTLELARLEGGGLVYVQPIWLKPFLQRLERTWKETESFEIDLVCNEDFKVAIDSNALEIILKNLVENAIRHSGVEKLKIIISLNNRDSGDRNEVLMTFADNGIGFAGEVRKLAQLFNKGVQSKGTGVGLYLVKTLMQKMNGEVQFASDYGTQSGFHVTLKFKQATV